MLKIKLARFGKINQPHFRVVVNEAKDKRDGSYVEKVGHYAPAESPKILVINQKRYQYWVSQGAVPTDAVAALYKRSQSKNPFPARKPQLSKKAKAKLVKAKEEAAAPQVEAAPPVEVAPVETAAPVTAPAKDTTTQTSVAS